MSIDVFCAASLSAFVMHYFNMLIIKLSDFMTPFEYKHLMKISLFSWISWISHWVKHSCLFYAMSVLITEFNILLLSNFINNFKVRIDSMFWTHFLDVLNTVNYRKFSPCRKQFLLCVIFNDLLATGCSYIPSDSLFIIVAICYSSCSSYLGI